MLFAVGWVTDTAGQEKNLLESSGIDEQVGRWRVCSVGIVLVVCIPVTELYSGKHSMFFILHHLPGHPCHIIKWYNLLVIEYTKHCTRAQGCALPSPEPPPRVAICPVEIYGAWVAIAFLLYEAAAFFKCCLRVLFEEHRIMGINTTSHLNHLSFEKVLTSCRLLHVWAWSSFMSVGRIVPSAFPWEGAVGKKKKERKRMSEPPGFSWASSETAFCTSGQSFLISCAELCSEMGSSWNEARRLKMLSVLEGGCCTSTAEHGCGVRYCMEGNSVCKQGAAPDCKLCYSLSKIVSGIFQSFCISTDSPEELEIAEKKVVSF